MKHKSEIGNSLGIPNSTVWSNDLVDEKSWEEDIDAIVMEEGKTRKHQTRMDTGIMGDTGSFEILWSCGETSNITGSKCLEHATRLVDAAYTGTVMCEWCTVCIYCSWSCIEW